MVVACLPSFACESMAWVTASCYKLYVALVSTPETHSQAIATALIAYHQCLSVYYLQHPHVAVFDGGDGWWLHASLACQSMA